MIDFDSLPPAETSRNRILWVKAGTLLPPNTGGRLRSLSMLREISAAGHQVGYLGLRSTKDSMEPGEASDRYALTKEWVDWHDPSTRLLGFATGLVRNALFSRRPYVLDKYVSKMWRERIRAISPQCDLVVCDFLTPAPNFQDMELSCPAVLFQHNVESQIWKRLADSCTNPAKRRYLRGQQRRMWEAEKELSKGFDGIITVSPDDSLFCREQYRLTNVLGDVPTGVDVTAFASRGGAPEKPTIGFLGSMDWMPNSEGVLWFVREVLPQVRRQIPQVRLRVIGRNPPAAIRELEVTDPAIHVTGTVDEVQSHVHQCSVIAVPLLAGGGTRIKIYEAMAMGVPVVSTRVGAEGLPLTDGREIRMADTPEDLAAAICALLHDPALAAAQAESALKRITADFSWRSAAGRFCELCDALVKNRA